MPYQAQLPLSRVEVVEGTPVEPHLPSPKVEKVEYRHGTSWVLVLWSPYYYYYYYGATAETRQSV